MECQLNEKYVTPKKKLITDKIVAESRTCDGFLPNFSTPPNFVFKNPFQSPSHDSLHLPICSPDLVQSTNKTDNSVNWTICDISHLKPVDIDTQLFARRYKPDYKPNSRIQHKISSFFSEHSVVPSPVTDASSSRHSNVNKCIQLSGSMKVPEVPESILKSMDALDQYIYDEEQGGYINPKVKWECDSPELEKIFKLETRDIESDESVHIEEKLILSPIKEFGTLSKRVSDEIDRKDMGEFILSPIRTEKIDRATFTPVKTDNLQYKKFCDSEVPLKSGCRLSFCEDMSIDFVDEIKKCKTSFADHWDVEYKQVEFSCEDMECSFPKTPNSGLFNGRSKKLSQSFIDMHNTSIDDCSISEMTFKGNFNDTDTGYMTIESEQPCGKTRKNYCFTSTPTKKKL